MLDLDAIEKLGREYSAQGLHDRTLTDVLRASAQMGKHCVDLVAQIREMEAFNVNTVAQAKRIQLDADAAKARISALEAAARAWLLAAFESDHTKSREELLAADQMRAVLRAGGEG